MNANLDLKSIQKQVEPIIGLTRKYAKFLFFMFLATLCGFLLLQIQRGSQVEPTDDAVTEKLQTVPRPKIDQAALDTIQQLEDQNVEVQSLFTEARNNPFSE